MMHVAANKHVVAAFKTKPELMKQSDRAVGRELGVHHETVAAARKATGEFSPVEKRVCTDGKARKSVGENSPTENSCSNSKPLKKGIGADGTVGHENHHRQRGTGANWRSGSADDYAQLAGPPPSH